MQLPTCFVGPATNTFEQINVFPDKLRLNPVIISALNKAEIQVEISIPVEFRPEDLLPIDTCSEAVARFTGMYQNVQHANEDNMPVEPSHWTEIKIGYSAGRPKMNADGTKEPRKEYIKFKFRGMWFRLPKKWEALVREHVLGRTNISCPFRWGALGFVCAVEDTADAVSAGTSEDTMGDAPRCSAKPKPIHIGGFAAASDIAISTEGHEIQSGGFVRRKGTEPSCFLSLRGFCERFWIPRSLTARLFAEAKAASSKTSLDPSDYDYSLDEYLAGCRLVKPDNDTIRVTGNPNPEERMDLEKRQL